MPFTVLSLAVFLAILGISIALPADKPKPAEVPACQIVTHDELAFERTPRTPEPNNLAAHPPTPLLTVSRIGINGTQCGPESHFAETLFHRIDRLCEFNRFRRWHYGANIGVSRDMVGPADWHAGWMCATTQTGKVRVVLREWVSRNTGTRTAKLGNVI